MLSFGALKQAIGVGPHQVQARRGSVLGSAPGSANTSPQASTAPVPGAAAAAAASPAGVPAARPPVAGVPRGSMVVNSNPSRVSPAASSVPPVPPLASSTTASPAASSAAPPVAPGSADANARRASLTMSPGQRSLIPGAPAGTPGAVPAAVPAAAPAVAAVGAPGAPSSFLENLKGGMNQLFTSVSVGVNLGPAPVVHATATTAADGSVTYTNALAGQQQTPLAAGANRSRTNSDAALEQEILNKGVVTMPTHTSAVASSLLYTARRSSLATGNGAASPTSPTGVASHGGIAAGGGGIAASGAARRGSGVSAAAAAAAAGGERRPSLVPRSPSPAAGTSALPVVTAAMLSAAPTADELKEAKRYRYLGGYSLSLSIEQVLHTATATSGSSSSAATTSSTPSPSPVASLTAGKTLSFRVHFTPKADTNNAFAIGYILDGSPFPTSAVVKLAKCPADGKVFCLANFNRRAVIKLFGRMDDTAEVKGRFVAVDHDSGTELSGSCVLVETVKDDDAEGDEDEDVDLATAAAVLGISITEASEQSASEGGAGATGAKASDDGKSGKAKLLAAEGLQDPAAWLQLFSNVFGSRFDTEAVKTFMASKPEAAKKKSKKEEEEEEEEDSDSEDSDDDAAEAATGTA